MENDHHGSRKKVPERFLEMWCMICLLVCFYGEVVGRSYEILSMQQEFYHKKKINNSPSDLAMFIHQFSATLKFSYIGPCAAGRDLDFQSWFKASRWCQVCSGCNGSICLRPIVAKWGGDKHAKATLFWDLWERVTDSGRKTFYLQSNWC